MRPGRRLLNEAGDRTVFIILGIASALIVVFAYWYKPAFLVNTNLRAQDEMFSLRGAYRTPDEVVIVAIDEKSVNELGRWPWPRQKTARLIEMLRPAKAVAVDIVFSEAENRAADAALSMAIKEAGNVTLGYFFRNDSSAVPLPEAITQIKRSSIGLINFIGAGEFNPADTPAPAFSGVETNIPDIGRPAAGFGSFNIIPQKDGIYRSVTLVYGFNGGLYPNLALEAVRNYSGGAEVINTADYGIDSIDIGDITIPLNEEGALLLNFYGPGGSFKTYSASDVIEGRVSPDIFAGRLVFIGVTEKAVYDIRPVPVDALFPGVEILATIAGNIIERRFLIHDSRVAAFDIFMIVIIPVLFSLATLRARSTAVSLLIFSGTLIIFVFSEFYLFTRYSIKPGAVYPALSLLIAYISNEAYRNIVVEKKSRYLRKAFSSYVSPQLVSEILKDPGRLKLGGEKRVVTVLFSDIRGFTALSERLAPEGLVRLLNDYLNPMTRIVLDHEGMLDKYIGDAIMAVFNAPVELSGHAEKACLAALEMITKLNEMNIGWGWMKSGYPALTVGIGINTGEAVVGNMGAELRFDYTAIGDTVNLASRLEGMNKLYHTSVIISEYTYEEVKERFLVRELDLVRVKGRERPVVMYELLGEKAGPEAAVKERLMERFREGLLLFRSRRFPEARNVFQAILVDVPSDGPAGLYMERCGEYINAPPQEDWDGVYIAKTK
ncbi:MAG: adenylate/guanylate cyclase domain-containing protein [Deltaproteobacteria bacterium]|nr:adenylate/guanylate cyclase domain-containing protein [Deltaproteobacteria bacterium]